MDSVSSLSLLGFKELSVCLVDCMKTPGVLGTEPKAAMKNIFTQNNSSDSLTQMDLSVSLVECMKTPGLNGDSDHLNHNTLELKLKQEDEQLEREYDYLKLEQQPVWQDSGITAESNLFKEEDDKNFILVETKTEEDHGTDGTLLVFEENRHGTEGTAWLMQCPKLSESLKTAMLGANSGVCQQEVDVTSQKSQVDDTILDRKETNQQDTDAEAVETSESTSGDQTERIQQYAALEPRRHHCEHCGKSFARKSNVLRHQRYNCIRTRTQERPHTCTQCDIHSSSLHTGTGPGAWQVLAAILWLDQA
ncbi:zinc finger and SCAN domain-containing protein 21-like isoform X4 [Archocentrus centrarchus]|uniref:zinc finger and SCAN domain-containing protein 21-like isoform X4 n=1 Tax=Archocentrus centrarchus TaxID=63155 RepID=UPI0011E9D2C1|nr:zinc finger and SCAN domain-containing protein 21-like isoform X4 [Archocentrus centrarchus]